MEHILRCNSLKCRRELNDHAVVTTCSHIFCLDCSRKDELSGGQDGQRPICPACKMHLTNPDDVVVANLNPTEDYKTSVLSGLSPNMIMECAGRALSFWAYQATQQMVYQEYLAKTLTEKYGSLSTQMDKIIHDANGELSELRGRMNTMGKEHDYLKQKHEELIQAYREKCRKALQTQEMFDRSKRKEMIGHVRNAASDAVEHTIEASVAAGRFAERGGYPNQRPVETPHFPNLQASGMQHPGVISSNGNINNMAPPVGRNGNEHTNWAGFSSQGNQGNQENLSIQTPSTHRQRLATGNITPTPRTGLVNHQGNSATPLHRGNSASRSPLANLNSNGGFAGYGMSAGLKVSNPAGAVNNGLPRPVIRSRVAQRSSPVSGFPPNSNSAFGGAAAKSMFSNEDRYYR